MNGRTRAPDKAAARLVLRYRWISGYSDNNRVRAYQAERRPNWHWQSQMAPEIFAVTEP